MPVRTEEDEAENLTRLAATVERLRAEVREAHAGTEGRALVELAKGILVERLHCGPSQAARQLAELAEQAGVPQLELAADIINQAARDKLGEAADELLDAAVDPGPSAAVRLRSAESGVSAASDAQAVAESLLAHALAPLGATAVAIWAAGADASLSLAGFAGLTAEEGGRWRYVPPGITTPARRALTERRLVWVEHLDRTPSIGHREVSGARVTVPADAGGRILGVLEICWPGPLERLSRQIERQIEALATLCARTLDAPVTEAVPADEPGAIRLVAVADAVLDPALVLLPELGPDGGLIDFRIHHANAAFADPAGRPRSTVAGARLLEVYPMVAGKSGLFDKVEHVHATGEPFHAKQTTLTTLVEQVPVTLTAGISVSRHGGAVLLIWRVQDETARLASLLQHAQRLGRIGGFEENAVTGEIAWNTEVFTLYGLPVTAEPIALQRLSAHADPDDAIAIGRFLRTLLHHRRPASTAFRLQRPDGIARHIRVIADPVLDADGRLLTVRGAYQDISAQHWTEVALAATRDQLAHSEQQSAERNRLALHLQRAIMPTAPDPVATAGLRVAVHYRPAENDQLVGGDWYDAVMLPSKQILLSVGDIAGHGIEAATGMVVLRNALRGLAATGAGPAQLLTWLNLVAHHLAKRVIATAVCGIYDPATRVLRWARAGHLPPVLIRRQRASCQPMIGGILLGATSVAEYEEQSVQLAPSDILLLYTDGLIERKGRSIDEAIAQLLTLAEVPADSLQGKLDNLLTHSNADTDDDTCIVGIQLD
ncbi:SpoIIE family protein phosphatase [Amycolatopsis sp. 195334CR]|uniref:SpoIIE family protein phosphatase n=1 Tax=Amycolatopsis sp. 195334CR TaxID=2814588 RepID=UPI001A8DE23F|nr:SpoIIE family protein phosphatase [Amycolatopsis sp. 195334CR]MBN6040555.1 SpoIIE family protein phosphatase [Amycolatopsis sp. 195334CR]